MWPRSSPSKFATASRRLICSARAATNSQVTAVNERIMEMKITDTMRFDFLVSVYSNSGGRIRHEVRSLRLSADSGSLVS